MIHVGKIIREKIEEQGRSAGWVAERMNMSRTNLYKIYEKSSIDTEQLKKFGKVLNVNFFDYLNQNTAEEPVIKYKKSIPQIKIEITGISKEENEELTALLSALAKSYFEMRKKRKN